MDIKVGEYVRTNRGYFYKIKKIRKSDISEEVYIVRAHGDNYNFYLRKDNILKHSKNIIDLIEVGDIVEYQVNSLSELKVGRVKSYRYARSNKEYIGVDGFDITKIYIKSILTNKQFEENCYKVL